MIPTRRYYENGYASKREPWGMSIFDGVRNRRLKPVAQIENYRQILESDPGNVEASLRLDALLEDQLLFDEAARLYRQALAYHPNEERLHKAFVNVAIGHDGVEAVFRHYALVREDSRDFTIAPTEVLCCIVLRNELARLPYFLEYYRKKGIRTFIAVDNASSDGSFEYLLTQPDLYLWRSQLSFNQANFGAGWLEPILRTRGVGHWCLIVDADELLYYPEYEHGSIPELCKQLDLEKKRAFTAVHLDMYSDLPIAETHYLPGKPFEEVCPYFDRQFYHECHDRAGPFRNQRSFFGGVRRRIFGDGFPNYLSKVPLIKYDEDCILAGGQHWTNLPAECIGSETGCLLHFKFFSSFVGTVSREVVRKEHSGEASQYRNYERVLREQPTLTLFDPAESVRLENSRQLVRLGVMQAEEGGHSPNRASAPLFVARARPNTALYHALIAEIHELWSSRSFRLLQPLRNMLRRLHGRQLEIEPTPASEAEALATVLRIRQSLSWEITAPLRVLQLLLNALQVRGHEKFASPCCRTQTQSAINRPGIGQSC